jgi:Mn-containing catalase
MTTHPAARALTGYLLCRGGVHQIAYARAIEKLTGADLTKLFPTPRIATEKIPECRPHIERGEHKRLYRFSPDDYKEIVAVFNGPHPETGEELEVADQPPEGALPNDLPPQTAVFAPDYEPEEIKEIAEAALGGGPAEAADGSGGQLGRGEPVRRAPRTRRSASGGPPCRGTHGAAARRWYVARR